MSYANAPDFLYADNVIWHGAACSLGGMRALGVSEAQAIPLSRTWPTAAKAIYVPFVLQAPATLYQVGWHTGGTAAGNNEVGVYDAAGNKIISSTATAQGTINAIQWVNVTDTLLAPGQYWLAAMGTLATGTWFSYVPTAPLLAACGVLTQTSASPLPATATFALDNTLAFLPTAFLQMRSVM